MSMHPEYATMLGYTQAELEENFEDYLIDVANQMQITKEALLDKMRFWYNGYRFEELAPTIYNPVSTNLFFNHRRFKNFWFETGTPTHLINHLKKNGIYNFKLDEIPETAFNSFDIEKISTYGLLFQSGYLTIKSVDEFGFYTLDYPNYEVEHSLTGYLLDAYGEFQQSEGVIIAAKMEKAFAVNDINKVIGLLQTMFKSIPNQLFINNHNEAFYHTMVHLMFKYMGVVIQSEVNTSDGRCDAIVTTKTHIYILEFKLDQTPEVAFAQILNKYYATAFAHQNKEIIGIGVNFSNETKNITGFFAQTI